MKEKVTNSQVKSTISERIEALPPEFKETCNRIFAADNDLTVIGSLVNAIIGYVKHIKSDYSSAIEKSSDATLIAVGGWPAVQKIEAIMEGTATSFNKVFGTYNGERVAYLDKVELNVKETKTKEEGNGSK